ncbi:hypothetical protein [Flavobacterium sp.]|jgi:hypothetical protein|uniref:hypothetical protein n=1 Tax=Flavobacterium sp. TaxID=239 RepID=UPI0040480A5F
MRTEILNILEELNNPANDFAKKSYKVVTETIKTLFAKQGEKLGYCTAAHRNLNIFLDFEYDEGEWLFDLVWYKMNKNDDQIMTSIPLVLESELSDKTFGGLKVDFDKLLVATSSTKVFVTTIHEIEIKKKYIQKAINGFTEFRKGETLYLIIWDENFEGNFILEEFNRE